LLESQLNLAPLTKVLNGGFEILCKNSMTHVKGEYKSLNIKIHMFISSIKAGIKKCRTLGISVWTWGFLGWAYFYRIWNLFWF